MYYHGEHNQVFVAKLLAGQPSISLIGNGPLANVRMFPGKNVSTGPLCM